MTHHFFLLKLLLFCSFSVFSQNIKPKTIIEIPEEKIDKFNIGNLKSNQCLLSMNFAQERIKNASIKSQFQGKFIEKVELVYTNYTSIENFDNKALNLKRLKQLYAFSPELFASNMTHWEIINQTACQSRGECKGFFHGFVITYKQAFTAEDRKKEIKELNNFLTEIEDITEETTDIEETKKDKDTGKTLKVKKLLTNTNNIVFDVLDRHKNWDNALVVVDATGSMMPYLKQVLLWLKISSNIDKIRHITFFNDGDTKPFHSKKIGKTGGIYQTKVEDFESVKNALTECLEGGYGGDAKENDIEAIIESLNSFDDYEEVVLIADNWANMRDFNLISRIKKPVRVILCGATERVNVEYIELARLTGGSIHTIESDIKDLAQLDIGDTLMIGSEKYLLTENGVEYKGSNANKKAEKYKDIKYTSGYDLRNRGKKTKYIDIDGGSGNKNWSEAINQIKTLIAKGKKNKNISFDEHVITREENMKFVRNRMTKEYNLKNLQSVTLREYTKYRYYGQGMRTYSYALELTFDKDEKHIWFIGFRSIYRDAKRTKGYKFCIDLAKALKELAKLR